jgi:hypothetical protein
MVAGLPLPCGLAHDAAQDEGERRMDDPIPGKPQAGGPPPEPTSLAESALKLAELHRQMVELNARLEYLNLILKLGVR